MTTPYEILGISPDAGADQIRGAFQRLAFATHPDRNPGDEVAAARFRQVNAAHQILGDAEKRAAYDAIDEGWADPSASAPGEEDADPMAVVRGEVVDAIERDGLPEVVRCLHDVRGGAPLGPSLRGMAQRFLGRVLQRYVPPPPAAEVADASAASVPGGE